MYRQVMNDLKTLREETLALFQIALLILDSVALTALIETKLKREIAFLQTRLSEKFSTSFGLSDQNFG